MRRIVTRLVDSLELPPGPRRTLAISTLINTVGNGLYITGGTLYFTRAAGLPASHVGAGFTIAGFVALAVGIPAGRMADQWGPRRVWATTLVVETCAMAAFLAVRTFIPFLVVACVSQAAASASQTARMPMFRRIGGKTATRLRAVLRSLVNIGSSIGALIAGIAIQLDTDLAYSLLIIGNAVTFGANVLVVMALPRLEPLRTDADGSRHAALRDRAFIAVTVLAGLLTIQGPVLTFAVPLWIVEHTDAPRFMVAVVIIVNTAMVALLQLRATRGIDRVSTAAGAVRVSSIGLLVGFVLFGSASSLSATAATLVLLVAIVVQTVAELRYSAAEFELSFGLAPVELQGEYSGVFGLGQGLANAAGPFLLAALVLGVGMWGWVVLGVLMVACGLLTPPVVAWAERTRPPRAPDPAPVSDEVPTAPRPVDA
jgi:MFS family permease